MARTRRRGGIDFPLIGFDRLAARQIGDRERRAVARHLDRELAVHVSLHRVERDAVGEVVALPDSRFGGLRTRLQVAHALVGAEQSTEERRDGKEWVGTW